MKCVTEHVEETTCHCRLGEDFVDKIANKKHNWRTGESEIYKI